MTGKNYDWVVPGEKTRPVVPVLAGAKTLPVGQLLAPDHDRSSVRVKHGSYVLLVVDVGRPRGCLHFRQTRLAVRGRDAFIDYAGGKLRGKVLLLS